MVEPICFLRFVRLDEDRAIGLADRLGDLLARGIEIPGQLDLVELLDQLGRGEVAAFMAAHAVGDRPQALRLLRAIAVLIMVADEALMGPRPALDPERSEFHLGRLIHRPAAPGPAKAEGAQGDGHRHDRMSPSWCGVSSKHSFARR